MNVRSSLIFSAAIGLGLLACSSSDSGGTPQGGGGSAGTGGSSGVGGGAVTGGSGGSGGAGTATTNTYIATCTLTAYGTTICTDYYDCVGADAAKIKSECATAGGGVGSDTKCSTAGSGGKCTIAPTSGTPCTLVQVMPAGDATANQKVCESNLKGTYTAP
jgi:hypothetical protein